MKRLIKEHLDRNYNSYKDHYKIVKTVLDSIPKELNVKTEIYNQTDFSNKFALYIGREKTITYLVDKDGINFSYDPPRREMRKPMKLQQMWPTMGFRFDQEDPLVWERSNHEFESVVVDDLVNYLEIS